MAAVFAPQFFLLIGIELFLAGSIVTTLLEDYYPESLPYILDVGAFVGLIQLWFGPNYLSGLNEVLQFYYCIGFAVIALLSLVGANLYLFLAKRRAFLSGVFGLVVTVPACLVLLFFGSAYVNAIPVTLPPLPVLSWTEVYVLFFASAVILFSAMAFLVYQRKRKNMHVKRPTK
jgi:hypothetical protein